MCVDLPPGAGSAARLADMGIRPGVLMNVISGGSTPGPVVIRIGDSRVMLGRGLSHKVLVQPA